MASSSPYNVNAKGRIVCACEYDCNCRLDKFGKTVAVIVLVCLFALGFSATIYDSKAYICTFNNTMSSQIWMYINFAISFVLLTSTVNIIYDLEKLKQYAKIFIISCTIMGVIWTIIGSVMLFGYCSCTIKSLHFISFILTNIYNYIFYSSIISNYVYHRMLTKDDDGESDDDRTA